MRDPEALMVAAQEPEATPTTASVTTTAPGPACGDVRAGAAASQQAGRGERPSGKKKVIFDLAVRVHEYECTEEERRHKRETTRGRACLSLAARRSAAAENRRNSHNCRTNTGLRDRMVLVKATSSSSYFVEVVATPELVMQRKRAKQAVQLQQLQRNRAGAHKSPRHSRPQEQLHHNRQRMRLWPRDQWCY